MFAQPKQYFSVLAVFACLAFFPLAMPTSFDIDEAKSPLFETFPDQVGEWIGEEAPVDERTYEILETRNVLSRLYTDPSGDVIHLLLVGSRKDRRVTHPPEVCYTGSNFVIVNERMNTLVAGEREFPVKEFQAQSERDPSRMDHVLYTYKVGGEYTANYYSQQLKFAFDQITSKDTEVLLIRLAGANRGTFPEFLGKVVELVEKPK